MKTCKNRAQNADRMLKLLPTKSYRGDSKISMYFMHVRIGIGRQRKVRYQF